MSGLTVRPGEAGDIAAMRDIYNHYVRETPITFDIEPVSMENRETWFRQFAPTGRHRLFVAEEGRAIAGYAYSMQFRQKPAYDTSVEVTIYTKPDRARQGIGRALYGALFEALAVEDVHRALAIIVKPNPASEAFHAAFGFRPVGVLSDVGFKLGRYHSTGYWEKTLEKD